MIPLSVPNICGKENEYVQEALTKGWVSSGGSYVTKFEENVSQYLNLEGAVALQSGTAALHLAFLLSNVRENEEVIVPTLTFIAAVNPVKYVGAEPVFMDCDDSLNMDCEKLESFLKKECERKADGLFNKTSKRRIKAILVVHVFGNMAKIKEIKTLAETYGLILIEDATEAIGTHYLEGKKEYAGTIGDFGVYSFNGNKIITTGGGGMLVAKDITKLDRARYLSRQAKDDPAAFIHNEIGYNYRMTNLQAAVGVAQLEQLETFIKKKIQNFAYYKKQFSSYDKIFLMLFCKEARNNHWFYTIFLKEQSLTKEQIMKVCRNNGIQTRPIWNLIHTQKVYQKNQTYVIEKAFYFWKHCLNIPCSTNLSTEEMEAVSHIIKSC